MPTLSREVCMFQLELQYVIDYVLCCTPQSSSSALLSSKVLVAFLLFELWPIECLQLEILGDLLSNLVLVGLVLCPVDYVYHRTYGLISCEKQVISDQ